MTKQQKISPRAPFGKLLASKESDCFPIGAAENLAALHEQIVESVDEGDELKAVNLLKKARQLLIDFSLPLVRLKSDEHLSAVLRAFRLAEAVEPGDKIDVRDEMARVAFYVWDEIAAAARHDVVRFPKSERAVFDLWVDAWRYGSSPASAGCWLGHLRDYRHVGSAKKDAQALEKAKCDALRAATDKDCTTKLIVDAMHFINGANDESATELIAVLCHALLRNGGKKMADLMASVAPLEDDERNVRLLQSYAHRLGIAKTEEAELKAFILASGVSGVGTRFVRVSDAGELTFLIYAKELKLGDNETSPKQRHLDMFAEMRRVVKGWMLQRTRSCAVTIVLEVPQGRFDVPLSVASERITP